MASKIANLLVIRPFFPSMQKKIKLNLTAINMPITIHDHGFKPTTIHFRSNLQNSHEFIHSFSNHKPLHNNFEFIRIPTPLFSRQGNERYGATHLETLVELHASKDLLVDLVHVEAPFSVLSPLFPHPSRHLRRRGQLRHGIGKGPGVARRDK